MRPNPLLPHCLLFAALAACGDLPHLDIHTAPPVADANAEVPSITAPADGNATHDPNDPVPGGDPTDPHVADPTALDANAPMPVAPTVPVPVVPVALPTLKADVQTSATIAVNSRGKVLNPNFVGLSYEKTRMTTGYFSPSNKALVNLHRLLGPGVLRIGANGVDATHWDPLGAGRKSGTSAPADVDALASFATATGWKVIYAVKW